MSRVKNTGKEVKIMLSHLIKTGLALCLMVAGFAAETKAQETAATPTTITASAGISPTKRELIKELLLLTGDQKSTEAIVNSMLDQNEKDMAAMVDQAIDEDSPLTPDEQQALQRERRERLVRVNRRFRELFNQRVNFAQLMDEISYPIYDRFFNEEELRDLVVFYKTPTGRKTIQVYPQLLNESMARTSEALMPKIQPIISEIMEEEKKLSEKPQPPAHPAKAKKPQRRRRRS